MNETYRLSSDLKWLEQQPTMERPLLLDDKMSTIRRFNDAKKDYEKHLASLKKYPAEGFSTEHLGKDLVEGEHFKLEAKESSFTGSVHIGTGITALPLPESKPVEDSKGEKVDKLSVIKIYDLLTEYVNTKDRMTINRADFLEVAKMIAELEREGEQDGLWEEVKSILISNSYYQYYDENERVLKTKPEAFDELKSQFTITKNKKE
jgi:hypothetical protein